MARRLTPGQTAAVRALIARRAERRLNQEELARLTGVSLRAIQDIERFRAWPRPETRDKLERLGLGWESGHLAQIEADHAEEERHLPQVDWSEEFLDRFRSLPDAEFYEIAYEVQREVAERRRRGES